MTTLFARTAAVLAGLALLATACTTDDEADTDPEALSDRLSAAKAVLDEAASLEISIVGETTPSGAGALLSAHGIGDSSPAFAGDIAIEFAGGAEVEVIATGGEVYVRGTVLFAEFTAVDPATFGAPDPATFFHPETGVLSLIETTSDLKRGERRRDDSDGTVVITEITGTIAGSDVQRFLPTADAEAGFDVVYGLTDDDELAYIRITGPFYGAEAGEAVYVIEATGSDEEANITAP